MPEWIGPPEQTTYRYLHIERGRWEIGTTIHEALEKLDYPVHEVIDEEGRHLDWAYGSNT